MNKTIQSNKQSIKLHSLTRVWHRKSALPPSRMFTLDRFNHTLYADCLSVCLPVIGLDYALNKDYVKKGYLFIF